MGREKPINACCYLIEPIYVMLKILIFIFLHHGTKPMAIIVQENAYDGKPPKGVALATG